MSRFQDWLAGPEKPVLGVVIITSRQRMPRRTPLKETPGATTQLDSIWATARLKKLSIVKIREVRRPPSQRPLHQISSVRSAIEAAKHANAALVVDDMTRLVKGMEPLDAAKSLAKLNADCIGVFSATHGVFVHEMSAEQLLSAVALASVASRRRAESTSAGIAASGALRGRGRPEAAISAHIGKADARARRIGPIISDVITRQNGSDNFRWQKIAKELDAQGVQTPNGAAWSGVQVKRVWERYQRISRQTSKPGAKSISDDG